MLVLPCDILATHAGKENEQKEKGRAQKISGCEIKTASEEASSEKLRSSGRRPETRRRDPR